jgi:TonB family protein
MIGRWKSDLSQRHDGMIMRISLTVSLLLHLLIFLAFQKTLPFQGTAGELRTYAVELIRPPVEGLGADQIPQAEIGPLKEELSPPTARSADDQETITLDTADKRYVAYAGIIREKIMLQWRYPPEAKQNLIEGRLAVIFSLNRQGHMTRIDVVKPSGFSILDREALRAVSTAAPYPPFPEHVTVSRLNIEASFDYRIKASR